MNESALYKDVEIFRIQVIAIIVSVLFLVLIIYLIKNKRIKEEYSLLWLFFSGLFLFFSIWRNGLDYLSHLIGIAYPPAAIFMILLAAVFMILIQFSTIISKLSEHNKTLAQEIALLKSDVERQASDKEKDKSDS